MAEENPPYFPFSPPSEYDTTNIFVVDPILVGFSPERPSRPTSLPSNILFFQNYQCPHYNHDADTFLINTSEFSNNI